MLRKTKAESGLGVPQSVAEATEVPDIIELEGGGWVILVLDSIFMVIPKRCGEDWRERIERNFQHVRWKLKYVTLEEERAKVQFGGLSIETEVGKMSWGLQEETAIAWQAASRADMRATPRSYFSLVSFLRFAASVLGWPSYRMGRLTKVQSDLGKVTQWDQEIVPLEAMAEAKRLIQESTLLQGWIASTQTRRDGLVRGGCDAMALGGL